MIRNSGENKIIILTHHHRNNMNKTKIKLIKKCWIKYTKKMRHDRITCKVFNKL